MKLLAVVLLLLPLSGCLAEVVHDFTLSCSQFFITVNNKVTSPTVFSDNNNKHRYKQICQTLNNKAEFATLYDTANKIPVYSAYTFKGLKDCDRLNKWHIEPQLDDPKNGGKNMERVSDEAYKMLHPNPNQALDGQYEKSGFHRGHLAPVYHANSKSCADATFTLTNAAPQNPSFNRKWFHHAEKLVAELLSTKCPYKDPMYVVTGVVPGNTNMNNRVRVPSHYWTAYCCLDQNHQNVSGGYLGENIEQAINPQYTTRLELEKNLTMLYGQGFTLFGGGC